MNYRGVKNKMQRGKMGGVTFGEASPRNSGRLSKWPVKAGSVFVLVAWIFRSRWNQRYHYLNLNGLLDGRSWWPQSRVARWRFGDFITMLWYNRVRNNIRLWVLRDDSTGLPIVSGQQPQQQRKQHCWIEYLNLPCSLLFVFEMSSIIFLCGNQWWNVTPRHLIKKHISA